jgi:hypothetical protein
LAIVRDDACRFWEAAQSREMKAGSVVDHLELIPGRMGYKDATGFCVVRAMIEWRFGGALYLNFSQCF